MWSARLWVAAGVAVAVISAGAGRASAWASSDAGPAYPVEIRGGAAVSSIAVGQRGLPVDCGDRCSLEMRPGRYNVVVKDTQGHRTSASLDVHGPTRVTVTPGNDGARFAGRLLVWLGGAAVVAGGVALAAGVVGNGLENSCGMCEDSDDWHPLIYAGGFSLAAGILTAASGMMVRHWYGSAVLSETRALAPPPDAARLRLTPAVGPRWTGLALGGSF